MLKNKKTITTEDLEKILLQLPVGLTIQDKKGTVIYANELGAKLCGFNSYKKFLQTSNRKILKKFNLFDQHGNMYNVGQLPGRKVLEGKAYAIDTILIKEQNKNTQRWSRVQAIPIYDKNKEIQYAVNVFHDVTEEKKLEQDRDVFFAMTSHELKTPVTTLKILTQFLKQKFTTSGEGESLTYLNKMDKQVTRLTELINDLLDVTKIHAGKLEIHEKIFNLNELVRECVDDLQSVTTSHTFTLKEGIEQAVLGDRDRIGQVITNLLTNAIKYSPKKTEILILTQEKDGKAIVSVQDRGIGIAKKYQQSIFKQFFRLHKNSDTTYPGLGMGLFISYQIIQRHGGKIWVESEKGKGSTFYFSLPLLTTLNET